MRTASALVFLSRRSRPSSRPHPPPYRYPQSILVRRVKLPWHSDSQRRGGPDFQGSQPTHRFAARARPSDRLRRPQDLLRADLEDRERMFEQIYRVIFEFARDFDLKPPIRPARVSKGREIRREIPLSVERGGTLSDLTPYRRDLGRLVPRTRVPQRKWRSPSVASCRAEKLLHARPTLPAGIQPPRYRGYFNHRAAARARFQRGCGSLQAGGTFCKQERPDDGPRAGAPACPLQYAPPQCAIHRAPPAYALRARNFNRPATRGADSGVQ